MYKCPDCGEKNGEYISGSRPLKCAKCNGILIDMTQEEFNKSKKEMEE